MPEIGCIISPQLKPTATTGIQPALKSDAGLRNKQKGASVVGCSSRSSGQQDNTRSCGETAIKAGARRGFMNTGLVDAGRRQRKAQSAVLNTPLVGVRVVVVVLDAPGLEGVDEGREGDGAHDVLQQLVLAEGAVARVVADHEELRGGDERS